MLVDGLIFADETRSSPLRGRPGARAGGQRRLPARASRARAWPCPTSTGATASASAASAATDPADGGVVSPGGVGYDINCGVRLLRTNLTLDDVRAAASSRCQPAVRATSPSASGRAGSVRFAAERAAPADARRGARTSSGAGWRRPTTWPHRGGGLPRRRRARARQRPGPGPRGRPVRHARGGQPLRRGAGGRPRGDEPGGGRLRARRRARSAS